ncbi:MAG: hypothetical protein MJE77_33060 [Proteobacteria bacterium]|nr:hypothetical protein [Pseudomonadota bacterium]
MSSAVDIVRDLTGLVGSVDELLDTDTARAAPTLAIELGAQSQLNQAVDVLSGLVQELRSLLAELRDPLVHVGALSGVLGLVEPFIEGVEQIVSLSGEQLAEAGLGAVVQVTDPVASAVDLGGRVVASGRAVLDDLPSAQDLDDLLARLDGLAGTLQEYKAPAS